jgi:hypothetical protein
MGANGVRSLDGATAGRDQFRFLHDKIAMMSEVEERL